jgi:cell division protein FtsN
VAAEPVDAPAPEPVVVASAPAAAQAPASEMQSDSALDAAPSGKKRIVVQAGCFQVEANAIQIKDRLTAKGFAVTMIHDRDRSGRDWYVLRTAAFPDQASAADMVQKMRDAGQSDVVIVKLAPPSHGA